MYTFLINAVLAIRDNTTVGFIRGQEYEWVLWCRIAVTVDIIRAKCTFYKGERKYRYSILFLKYFIFFFYYASFIF